MCFLYEICLTGILKLRWKLTSLLKNKALLYQTSLLLLLVGQQMLLLSLVRLQRWVHSHLPILRAVMQTDLNLNFLLDNSSHLLASQYNGTSCVLVSIDKKSDIRMSFLICTLLLFFSSSTDSEFLGNFSLLVKLFCFLKEAVWLFKWVSKMSWCKWSQIRVFPH